MTTGIYKITNLVNGKVYIGASRNIEKRWISHRNGHTTIAKELQTFGLDNFKFEILLECPEDMLCQWERDMICLYDADVPEKGYNDRGDRPYNLNISKALKGRKHTDEARRKMSEAHKGHEHTDEARRKMSKSHKGKPSGMKGHTAWNRGIPHSEEHKRKLSEARKEYWRKKKEV